MKRPADCKSRARGVTLIELMIVVIILSVLAAIAFPSYRSYVIRTNRSEATAALLNLRSNQERFYLQNNSYADTAELTTAPPAGLGMSATTEGGRYTLSIVDGDAVQFSAQAVPATGGGQTEDDACQTFTINNLGVRTAANGGGTDNTAECWR